MKSFLLFSLFLTIPSMSFGIERDKQLHIGASAVLSTAFYATARNAGIDKRHSAAIAFISTMAVGMAKELTDDFVDTHDLAADSAGAILPLIVLINF